MLSYRLRWAGSPLSELAREDVSQEWLSTGSVFRRLVSSHMNVSSSVSGCSGHKADTPLGHMVNGPHSYSALLTSGHSKHFTISPNIHPFMHTFTHRNRGSQPHRARASSSGTVRVRCLAQGHLDSPGMKPATFQLPVNPLYVLSHIPPLHARSHMTTLKPWTCYKVHLVYEEEVVYVKQQIQKTLSGKQDMCP